MKPNRALFAEDYQFYHVFTRAVEKRGIFNDEEDRLRFIFQMHAAKIGKPIPNLYRNDVKDAAHMLLQGIAEPAEKLIIIEHDPLAEIASFCLVGDHIHLLLHPNAKDGIFKYMQKLKLGFAKYFNLKHGREGNLFARPYKLIPVETDPQLMAVIFYINIKNVLDVWQPGWKETGLKNQDKFFKFLREYQYSSFPDLFGNRNSKIIAQRSFLESYIKGTLELSEVELNELIHSYLSNKLKPFDPLFLEAV